MTHTPGPWDVLDKRTVYAAPFQFMLTCKAEGALAEEWEANARLIAAAPDMLAALKLIRFEFKEFLNDDKTSRMIRDRIDAAIKKAEGES